MERKLFWVLILTLLCACSSSGEREALFATVSSAERGSSSAAAVVTSTPVEGGGDELTTAPVKTVEPTQEPNEAAASRLPQLQNHLSGLAETGQFMGAVLVAQDGQILINEGYGLADIETGRANTAQTQLRIGSLTKQFTAAAILRLQELGKLNVDDPVSVYLMEYPGGDQITIHQLLTHSAGVPNYNRPQELVRIVHTPVTLTELLARFSSQPLDFPPGQRFAYSDSGYVVLTAVIEAASGMSYAGFLQEQLFDPLGMTETGYDYLHDDLTEPATGYHLTPGGPQRAVDTESSWASGAGALYSTVQDLYRWDRALNGNQLLEEASLNSMFTPWVEMGQGYSYGYGWEIGQMVGRASQTHAGNIFGFGSFIARFPEENATIIILGNGFQMSPRIMAEDLAQILFGVNRQ